MSFSDYLVVKFLNHLFGKSPYTIPVIYASLWDGNPAAGGVEVTGSGYARVITYPSWWSPADSGVMTHSQDIVFPQAASDWGAVSYFALHDAASGGNRLLSGALSPWRDVVEGSIPKFVGGDPGGIVVTLDEYYYFNDYLENSILDHLFNKSWFTVPTIYVSLWNGNPGEAGTGPGAEITGAGYARVLAGNTYWSSPYVHTIGIYVVTNDKDISFGGAESNWGVVDFFALFDAASGGNALIHGPLSTPVEIIEGDVPIFSEQSMFLGLSGP